VRLVPKFKEYDRDGNGYISLQEASTCRTHRHQDVDILTRIEFGGLISLQEASTILQNKPFNFPADKVVVLLRKFDKDGNGKLDIDEFADFYAEAKATCADLSLISYFIHFVFPAQHSTSQLQQYSHSHRAGLQHRTPSSDNCP